MMNNTIFIFLFLIAGQSLWAGFDIERYKKEVQKEQAHQESYKLYTKNPKARIAQIASMYKEIFPDLDQNQYVSVDEVLMPIKMKFLYSSEPLTKSDLDVVKSTLERKALFYKQRADCLFILNSLSSENVKVMDILDADPSFIMIYMDNKDKDFPQYLRFCLGKAVCETLIGYEYSDARMNYVEVLNSNILSIVKKLAEGEDRDTLKLILENLHFMFPKSQQMSFLPYGEIVEAIRPTYSELIPYVVNCAIEESKSTRSPLIKPLLDTLLKREKDDFASFIKMKMDSDISFIYQ